MNESQRILFAAAHAGDTPVMLNNHLGNVFLMLFIAIVILVCLMWFIDTVLNSIFTYYERKLQIKYDKERKAEIEKKNNKG